MTEKTVYDASRRHEYKEEKTCETLQSFWGTGGGNVPIVVEKKDDRKEHLLPGESGKTRGGARASL